MISQLLGDHKLLIRAGIHQAAYEILTILIRVEAYYRENDICRINT
jgi:hypothetical protein